MENKWKYLDNQFVINTNGNYKKAMKLSNYHDSALQAASATEPLLVPVYNRYHPLHLSLVKEYNEWKSAGGAQEGQTLNLAQQLSVGVSRIDIWDPQIQILYPKTTPRYRSIFPTGRKVFTKGSIDERINAFNTLSMNIGADVALAAVKAEVDTTYTTLDGARDSQEAAKGTTKAESDQVDAARIAAMNMQYRNLGFVMDNFFLTLDGMAAQLFDQQTLRDHRQTVFTGTLDPGETEPVLVHTFLADDELKLKSNGNAKIRFYLASTSGGTDSAYIEINENEERTILVSAFGALDLGIHRHLTAINQSAAETTQYIVTLE